MLVELVGVVVDGVDDDDSPAADADRVEGGEQRVGEQLAAVASAVELFGKGETGQEEAWDDIRGSSSNRGRELRSAHCVGKDREVADNVRVGEPDANVGGAGPIRGQSGSWQPAVEIAVSGCELVDVVIGREPFDSEHLRGGGVGSGPFGGTGQCWDDLGRLVQLVEERIEEVRWHESLVREAPVGSLAGNAIDSTDLGPAHPRGLGLEQNPTLHGLDTGSEDVHSPHSVTSIRRVEEAPDVGQQGVDIVNVLVLLGLHAVKDMLTTSSRQQKADSR